MTEEPTPAQADKFYRGKILRLFRGSQGGVVLSATGRETNFAFLHVVMLGDVRKFDDLREGMEVGFDVGWTSHGLQVTVMKVIGS